MMRRHRRSAAAVMGLAAMALAAIAAGSGRAQTVYPERVIKLIVPAPAGGQTDVMARLMAQKMQQSLGQSVIIENRAGAGGALGARTAAAADPDGYTLVLRQHQHAGRHSGGVEERGLRSRSRTTRRSRACRKAT